jgi:hypothetical protein
MNKVEITISGRRALVDDDQVKLHVQKQKLIVDAAVITTWLLSDNKAKPTEIFDENERLSEIGMEIIRINRRIRKNVQFIK